MIYCSSALATSLSTSSWVLTLFTTGPSLPSLQFGPISHSSRHTTSTTSTYLGPRQSLEHGESLLRTGALALFVDVTSIFAASARVGAPRAGRDPRKPGPASTGEGATGAGPRADPANAAPARRSTGTTCVERERRSRDEDSRCGPACVRRADSYDDARGVTRGSRIATWRADERVVTRRSRSPSARTLPSRAAHARRIHGVRARVRDTPGGHYPRAGLASAPAPSLLRVWRPLALRLPSRVPLRVRRVAHIVPRAPLRAADVASFVSLDALVANLRDAAAELALIEEAHQTSVALGTDPPLKDLKKRLSSAPSPISPPPPSASTVSSTPRSSKTGKRRCGPPSARRLAGPETYRASPDADWETPSAQTTFSFASSSRASTTPARRRARTPSYPSDSHGRRRHGTQG